MKKSALATKADENGEEELRDLQLTQEAQARYEVSGTPTFVVDGQVVYSGEYPWDHIKPMLDDKLAKKP